MKEKGRIPEESHQMPVYTLLQKNRDTKPSKNFFFFLKKADKNDLKFCS